ncbi:MAG: DUF2279 domain-containing protein [Candidatus Cloacimonetes bacterium]|nr:DUF2279 domain-containing protein [Candidatus Cloacimonadota bacterium]
MKHKIILLLIFLFCIPLSAHASWTGKDKIAHFLGSTYITCWNYGVMRDIGGCNAHKSKTMAISMTVLLGGGKELSDKKLGTTGWSWEDMAYNCAGIAAGLVLINARTFR